MTMEKHEIYKATDAFALVALGYKALRKLVVLLDDVVDEDAGSLDIFGGDAAGFHNFLRFDYNHIGCGCHHGAEVLGSTLVHQVTALVADVGSDDGHIGADGFLQKIFHTVHSYFLFYRSRPRYPDRWW